MDTYSSSRWPSWQVGQSQTNFCSKQCNTAIPNSTLERSERQLRAWEINRTHKEAICQYCLQRIHRSLGNFCRIIEFSIKYDGPVGYICVINECSYSAVHVDWQMLGRMRKIRYGVLWHTELILVLTTTASVYIRQTVRARGRLFRPLVDLLARTHSVTQKKGVKMPSCWFSTYNL